MSMKSNKDYFHEYHMSSERVSLVCYNPLFRQQLTENGKQEDPPRIPADKRGIKRLKADTLYLELQQQLTQRIRDLLKRQYDLDLPRVVVDQPPNVALGEYALPLSFELAKKLRKPPRKIAEEIVAGLGTVPGFEKFEVAGAGYINAKVNRQEAARLLLKDDTRRGSMSAEKIL